MYFECALFGVVQNSQDRYNHGHDGAYIGGHFLLLVFYTMFFSYGSVHSYEKQGGLYQLTSLALATTAVSGTINVDHSTVNSYLSAFYYL